MFKQILISTDGSPVSMKAARAGIALAKSVGARITAYCAVEPLQTAYWAEGYALSQEDFEAMEQSSLEVAQKQVDAIGKLAKAAQVPFVGLVTKALTAYEGIIGAAKRRKCDVIFMASHGRRGFSKLIMGSVTQAVLTHSRIPVVVFR